MKKKQQHMNWNDDESDYKLQINARSESIIEMIQDFSENENKFRWLSLVFRSAAANAACMFYKDRAEILIFGYNSW